MTSPTRALRRLVRAPGHLLARPLYPQGRVPKRLLAARKVHARGVRTLATACAGCTLASAPPPPGWSLRPGDPSRRAQVTCPEAAAELVIPLLVGADRELCLLVALDTKHRLLGVSTVSIGTAQHTFMAPREVYRDALLAGASAIFLAHNHPSGDATPSADDRAVTRRLAQAGTTLGVELLDHLVVGDPDWTSLARLGAL